MIFWIAITAIATAVIAYSAYTNNKLAKEIKETREKHDEEIKDLFQAMVIASISSGPHTYDEAVYFFKKNYQGKTEVSLPWPKTKNLAKDEGL
jgi:hypothetical protein